MTQRLDWLKRPFAHRGLHDAARGIVENTAGSVRAALEHDFGIEVDLRLAACGTPMVFHDADLSRLTHANGRLAAHTREQLQAIRFRGCNEPMLTLAELLSLVAGRTPMLLELKSERPGDTRLTAAVVETIRSYDGPFAVMSFEPALLERSRELAPQLPRGLVAERYQDHGHWPGLSLAERLRRRHLLSAWRARPHFIAYDVEALPSLAPYLARRLFGLPLLTWTVRTPLQRRRAQRHADAMIFEGFVPTPEDAI